ncbi:Putative Citrate synthase [Penicillium brasilianum]|uniref:Putative Citrate synthase n=1 Tax=Penicillium brasilianum TaxID=104259 RepID=A0A0F7TQZ4_PENBI|nr:Putative Citrate synthase [Penicillium brasilianum]
MSNSEIEGANDEDEENAEPVETTSLLSHASPQKPYSVFSNTQKRLIILVAAIASTFSPLSANIYFPALSSIAKDLGVSPSQINLTITTYMICQGLAPTFTGSLADQAGRRPAYIICFVVYIVGNIALALQHSFPTLLVLRAIQSCGSSGTVALASAVAADIITSAERGTYMGLTSLGNILAPSLGPIAGGLLTQYLGWQAIFWFLAIIGTVFFVVFVLFFPETCRVIVGDGSIPPSGWNRSLWDCVKARRSSTSTTFVTQSSAYRNKHLSMPNPWPSLRLLFRRPVGLVLLANGITFGSYYSVTAGIPAQFAKLYDLNDFQVGLCYIPAGLGSLLSATANGVLVDWNYRRIGIKEGISLEKDHKHHLLSFPIEKARLQIGIPMIVLAGAAIAVYGSFLAYGFPFWAVLLMVFISCFCITAAYNIMNVLIVDLYYTTPATAMAANNLVRCFLGAGTTAAVNPLINAIGTQWTLSLALTTFSPPLLPLTGKQLQIRYPSQDWIKPGSAIDIQGNYPE